MDALPIAPDAPWLAPLAGYSDLPFRMLCREQGAAVAVTEMVSAKGLDYDSPGTERLLDTCEGDAPLVVQLFGADPERFHRMTAELAERGYTHFDLNAGCPVRKVLKTGGGCALLKDPDLLVAVARAMVRAAGPGRVGVKTRPGFEMGEDRFPDLAHRLQDAGVAWLTLHPRFGRQMFTGGADWSHLARLKAATALPVIASGDLFTAEDALACRRATGVDAVMFARGAMADPTVFARYHALRRGERPPERDGAALAAVVRRHIELARTHDPTPRGFRKMRSIIPRYAKGLDGIRALRERLTHCTGWDELTAEAAVIADLPPARA